MPGGNDDQSNYLYDTPPRVRKPKAPNEFEQAASIQSAAAIGGADAEIAALQEAIAQLSTMLGVGTDQYTDAGLSALQGVQQGSTIQGFDDRLTQILGGDQFQGLVDDRTRAVQGQLSAGGLTRSGTAVNDIAAIPTDLALAIESNLYGRESGLAGLGYQSQNNDLARQYGLNQQIASLLGLQGASEAGGITGAAEAEAGGILGEKAWDYQQDLRDDQKQSGLFGALGLGAGYALSGGNPAVAGIGGAIGSALGFSDPRLKENVQVAGKVGPLDLVTWDWIEEAKDTIVGKFKTVGFMSDQVREHYPEMVTEYGGFDVIDYPRLMEALDNG